ncbi:hypothetical protein MBLNU457_g2853t1 [Dothideomycetes sp. NU457]
MATTDIAPDGVNHYEASSDMPENIQKHVHIQYIDHHMLTITYRYWHQRYDLFSRYDEGIWLTDDAWFGVTPEAVADKIASDISTATLPTKKTLIDAFAGAGGNSIAFARSGRWEQIFAIEKDAKTLECAKHNAAIYGVKNKIVWIQGDCFEVMRKRLKSFTGPQYTADNVFGLHTMQPYGIGQLYTEFTALSNDVVLYLPRTSDLNELAVYAKKHQKESGKKMEVAHYCIRGVSKALCAYFGGFEFT